MRRSVPSALAVALVLAAAAPSAQAQHRMPAPAPAPSGESLQGDQESWINDPHMHAFYAAAVVACAKGAAKADVPAFETRSFAIFRDFGASRGTRPEAMQDHLKLIPRQIIQIAKEDPHVLDTYDTFVAALFGPK